MRIFACRFRSRAGVTLMCQVQPIQSKHIQVCRLMAQIKSARLTHLETLATKEKRFFFAWSRHLAHIGCTSHHEQRPMSSPATAIGQSKDHARKAGPRANERMMAFAVFSLFKATLVPTLAVPAVAFRAVASSRAYTEGFLPALSRWFSMAPWCSSMSTILVVHHVRPVRNMAGCFFSSRVLSLSCVAMHT